MNCEIPEDGKTNHINQYANNIGKLTLDSNIHLIHEINN